MKSLNILLIEDDLILASELLNELESRFCSVNFTHIKTESEFNHKYPDVAMGPPDIVILDMMLRWAGPEHELSYELKLALKDGLISKRDLPSNYKEPPSSPFRAGLRCFGKLERIPETRNIPVIFHTVVDRGDVPEFLDSLPEHVLFLNKKSDKNELITYIRSLTQYLPENPPERKSFLRRAFEATEAKPGWLGFNIDLKKLFSDE